MLSNRRQARRLATASALVILLSISTVALAQPHGPKGRGGFDHDPGARMERLFDRLDLTEEQRVAIEQELAAHREQVGPLREQARTAHEALGNAIHAEVFDEAAIRTAAAVVGAIQEELAVSRAEIFVQIRQHLTPEQHAQLDQIQQRMRERVRSENRQGPGGRSGRGRHADRGNGI